MITVTPTEFPSTTSPVVGTKPQQISTHEENGLSQEETPKVDPTSSQFAALARKEKIIRQREKRIEAERNALKSRESEIENLTNSKWKEKLSQNPWDALIEAGLTPDQVNQVILNQPRPEDIQFRNLQKEIDELKSSQNQTLENLKKSQQESYEQAKRQIASDVSQLVKSDDSFETIRYFGKPAESEVVNLVEEVFHQGWPDQGYPKGSILPLDFAAQKVEEYYVNQAKGLMKLKKINPQPSFATSVAQKTNESKKPIINTLSNRVQTSAPVRNFTDKERRNRAILRAQGIDPDSQ